MFSWYKRQSTAVKVTIPLAVAFWGIVIGGTVLASIMAKDDVKPRVFESNPQSSSKSAASTASPAPTTSVKKPTIVDIGQPLTVGNIKLTAGAPEKHAQFSADNPYIDPAIAKGVYVLVPITIENVGSSTITISYEQLALIDAKERTFQSTSMTDWDLSMVIGADKMLTYAQLNPNVPYSTIVIFDIPADATSVGLALGNDRWNPDKYGFIRLGF